MNPVSTRVEIGQQMELRCVPPAGLPPPRVYWLRGGQPLQTDTAILVSSEGHLLIGQARAQDTGNYTCVAENIAAKRVAPPALIRVYGKYTIQSQTLILDYQKKNYNDIYKKQLRIDYNSSVKLHFYVKQKKKTELHLKGCKKNIRE